MADHDRSLSWQSCLLWGIGLVLLCSASGVIGGVVTRSFGANPQTAMQYSDFISIMLTAVSLLMTVLAIFLAVVGFVGWNSIEQKVQNKTVDFLAKGFDRDGQLERIVNRKVAEAIREKTDAVMFEGIQEIPEENDGEFEAKYGIGEGDA